jgi:FkbM family methyltransferase
MSARVLPASLRRGLYRLGPVTRWLRGRLTSAAPAGIRPVRIAAGPLAGDYLLLDLKVDKDLWLGTYESQLERAIQAEARPGMTAYDLGANVGYVTMLLARAVGESGTVVAIEAMPDNVSRLQEAVRLNGMTGRVTVLAKAVGARQGRDRFLVHASPGMGRLGEPLPGERGFQSSVEVDVVTIDGLVDQEGFPVPDVLKIDVEGGEIAALEGMRQVLSRATPVLLIETHHRQAGEAVRAQLTAAGYSLFDLDRGGVRIEAQTEVGRKMHLLAKIP